MTKKYALAVSGGIDSMVMLHIFAQQTPRPDFFVVTINHNLRAEGAGDCRFVQDYCRKLSVPCKVFSVDVPAYCAATKVSDETGARLLRLGVLNSLDVDWVCTAHHADDNAETVLMHLVRGSGAGGVEGIRAQSGKFLHPMLSMTRRDIEDYAAKFNVPHVFDATNGELKYARNYLRNEIMPLMRKLNSSASANITRFAASIAEDNAYLESLADDSTVKVYGNRAEIPCQLLRQPRPIAYRILKKTFRRLNVWCDIEKSHFDAILRLADNVGGKQVSLPFNMTAVNDYDKISILKNCPEEVFEFELPFKVGATSTPVGTVVVSSDKLPASLMFDPAKIPATAVFRTCRPGDSFTKFGGGGTKPLNRYLVDKKIPARKRQSLLLLADGSNVLVICGVEISNSVRVEPHSDVHYIALIEQ